MSSSMLWLGILPIVAFVVLDSFTKKTTALYGALALGVGEIAFSFIKFGALDYLSFLSLGILVLFVILSLKLKNDVYFKIQSAVVNTVFAIVLLIANYVFHKNLFIDMVEKYIGYDSLIQMQPILNETMIKALLNSININLPWWLIGHSLLVGYSAYKWNKWVWFSIRVPGFYLMLFIMGSSLRPF